VPVGFRPIKGSLAQLRDNQDALARFIEQLFYALEQSDRQDTAGDDTVRRQRDQLAAERANMERELEAAREEISELAGTAVELANARVELADARAKAVRLRDQLAASSTAEQELRLRLGDAELERRRLEAELDMLSRRSAELAEDLAAQRRQTSEERLAWNAELRAWRLLWEKQAASPAAQHTSLPISDLPSGAIAPETGPTLASAARAIENPPDAGGGGSAVSTTALGRP
jgi:chromosome segregation ATPase